MRVRHERRVWIFRFTKGGKKREMGLGPTTIVSLSTARELAEKARTAVANGLDPIEVRKGTEVQARPAKTPNAITFESAMLRHIGKHRHEWSSGKHQLLWENSLRNC